jgi:hypothetical protein
MRVFTSQMHRRCYLAMSLLGCGITLPGCSSDSHIDDTTGCVASCGAAGGSGASAGGASSGGSGGSSGSVGNGGANLGGRAGSSGGTAGTGGLSGAGGTAGAGGNAAGRGGAPPGSGGATDGGGVVTPGWNLVAIDTAKRTYLDYVEVPASGTWTPEADRFPVLATWENQTAYSAIRFRPFTPGNVLTPSEMMELLPLTRLAAKTISITDAPYNAARTPADATQAIQRALDDAAATAKPGAPVDVLVPSGTFDYSHELRVGADVRLRRFPEDSGGLLHATNPAHGAIHLAGDRSGALFLFLTSEATARDTTPWSSGIWVGGDTSSSPFVHDVLVVGNDVGLPASAHVVGIAEEGGLWAFNFAHDGFADTFHHTGGSRYCQVVGNRAQTSSTRGDDHYAFVSYQGDGDVVHHCTCIANSGRDGAARGLSVVGGGFILLDNNDIDRTKWAGVYLAQENSYQTYGSFDVTVSHNAIRHANLGGSHDGLLAYTDAPGQSHAAASFGSVPNRLERIYVRDNTFSDTAAGIGNGFGVEIRSSVDTGEVTGNVLTGNQPPQLVVNGTNFTTNNNQIN